jgi:PhnB protein
MPQTWKPEAYTSVSPYLVVRAADAVVRFLEVAFGAATLTRYDHPDGSIMHAELRIDDSVVMIGGAVDGYDPVPAHVHVYVDDVDVVYRRALQAGGTMVQAPERRGIEPDRRAGIRDPGGVTWWIATRVTPEEPEPEPATS